MKAWQIAAAGGPEQLVLRDEPRPEPGEGQVVVAVAVAGMGYADIMMRQGAYPGVDVTGWRIGEEIAGTVSAAGPGVPATLVGQRVYAYVGAGGYAEAVIVDADRLIELPDDLSFQDAVAAGENALVAELALTRGQVAPGTSVLVRGASGAVASTIVQFVVAAGAICTAATSRPDAVAGLGAHHVTDRSGGDGEFDVVIDPVGGNQAGSFIGRLKPNGRLVICGAAGGFPEPNFAAGLLMNFQRSPTISVLSLNSFSPADLKAAARAGFAKLRSGAVTPVIGRIIGLDDVREAHVALANGQVVGKIVIQI